MSKQNGGPIERVTIDYENRTIEVEDLRAAPSTEGPGDEHLGQRMAKVANDLLRNPAIVSNEDNREHLVELLRAGARALTTPGTDTPTEKVLSDPGGSIGTVTTRIYSPSNAEGEREPVAWSLEWWTGESSDPWKREKVTDNPDEAAAWGSPSERDSLDPGLVDRSDCFRAVPLGPLAPPSPEPEKPE